MTRRSTRWTWGFAVMALAAGFLSSGQARAGLVIEDIIVQQIPDPVFQVSIGQVQLTGTSQIFRNDYFTVYDFPEELIIGSNNQPVLWAASGFELIGQTPDGVEIEDNGALRNVTFRYIGRDRIRVPVGQSSFDLGIFQVTVEGDADDFPEFFRFAYSIHDGNGKVEVGTGTSPVTINRLVPEPASLTMLALGAPLAAWGLRKHRRGLIR